jgi:hypothetical protein
MNSRDEFPRKAGMVTFYPLSLDPVESKKQLADIAFNEGLIRSGLPHRDRRYYGGVTYDYEVVEVVGDRPRQEHTRQNHKDG